MDKSDRGYNHYNEKFINSWSIIKQIKILKKLLNISKNLMSYNFLR